MAKPKPTSEQVLFSCGCNRPLGLEMEGLWQRTAICPCGRRWKVRVHIEETTKVDAEGDSKP